MSRWFWTHDQCRGASQAEHVFKASETVPESGVYAVIHDQHRAKHYATVFKGDRFPACGRCGKSVRFVLSRPASLISEDLDFKEAPNAGNSE